MQVITLLEAYTKRSPQAALLLRALPVLLGTLRRALAAGAPEQALAERLRGLITNKLCKCVQCQPSCQTQLPCTLCSDGRSQGDLCGQVLVVVFFGMLT